MPAGSTSLAARLPFHYGWLIVAVAALMSGVTSSIRMSFGVFLDPLQAQFGWSRADMALSYSIQFGAMAVMAVGVGWLADRFGAKRVLLVGGLGFSLSITLTGTSTQLWQLYLYYGLILGAAMACFVTPLHSTTSLWFRQRIGLAVGLVVAFQAVGPFFGAPIFRWMTETVGWERCFFYIGGVSLVVLVVAALLFKNRPQDVGVRPYAEEKLSAQELAIARAPTVDGNTLLKRAVRTQPFWITITTHFLGCVSHSIPLLFVVSIATFRGMDGVLAATVLGAISGVSIASKLSMSIIAEHLGGRRVLIAVLFIQSSACLLLLFADQAWMFFVFALIFGLGYGGEMVVYPMLNRQYYGSAPFASIYGWQMAGASFGMAAGGYIGGLLFEFIGDYGATIWVAVLAGYVGVVAAVIMKRPNPQEISAPDATTEAIATTPQSAAGPVAVAPVAINAAMATNGATNWIVERAATEKALAARLDTWSREAAEPELAEVLEIAAARTRDRSFRLRRAAGASANGRSPDISATAPLGDLLDGPPDPEHLQRAIQVLAALADAAALPEGEASSPLVQQILAGTQETQDLLRQLIDPDRTAADHVRLLNVATRLTGEGFEAILYGGSRAGAAPVWQVWQRPGARVRWPGGTGRCLVPLAGSGLIRPLMGAAPATRGGTATEIGSEAAALVEVSGDLPFVYLVVGRAVPAEPGTWEVATPPEPARDSFPLPPVGATAGERSGSAMPASLR